MILRLGVVWHKLWLSFEMIPYHGFLWYRSVELPKYFFSCPWIPVYILYLHLYKKIQSVNWRECGYVYLCLRFKQDRAYLVHSLTSELLIFCTPEICYVYSLSSAFPQKEDTWSNHYHFLQLLPALFMTFYNLL